MGEITKEEMRERMGNIDQIRDIIFGPKLQDYDSRIGKLESNLSLLEQEMRDRTTQIKTECLTELRASIEAINQTIKSVSLTSQKDHADIRQLIDRTYINFSTSLDSLDKTVEHQTTSIRKDLSDSREKLQDEIKTLKSQVFDELEKRFSILTKDKLSRNGMADVLFELGLRLKKSEFAELKAGEHQNGTDEVLLIEASKVSD
jgi:hypothetical protein